MVRRYKLFLIMVLVLLVLSGCQKENDKVPELKEPVGIKVDTAVAKLGEICDINAYEAEIVPYVEEAGFLQDGVLKELHVTVGELVEEGQILATLEDELLLKEIAQREEQFSYTRKMGEYRDQELTLSIEIAKREAEQIRTGWGNREQLLLKENEMLALETDLKQEQELRALDIANQSRVIKTLKEELEQMQLIAPISGKIVYIKNVQIGSQINGYETMICIADESRLHVASEVIAESLIESADELWVQVLDRKYQISYMPYEREEYMNMLLAGEEVRARFAITEDHQLESGQFGAVILKNDRKENVLLIPVNAVYLDQSGRYVYRMDGEKRIRQDVTVGKMTDLEAEILEGLQEGDVVYVKE